MFDQSSRVVSREAVSIRKSLFHLIFVLFYLNVKPKLWKLILNLKDPLQPFMRSYNINNDALASWISLPVFLDSLLFPLQEMKAGSAAQNGCPWGFGGEKAILAWTQRGHDPMHHWAAVEGRGDWWTQRFNSSILVLFCSGRAELEQWEVSSRSCSKRRVQCNQMGCMQPSFISYTFHCSHHSLHLVSACLLPHSSTAWLCLLLESPSWGGSIADTQRTEIAVEERILQVMEGPCLHTYKGVQYQRVPNKYAVLLCFPFNIDLMTDMVFSIHAHWCVPTPRLELQTWKYSSFK